MNTSSNPPSQLNHENVLRSAHNDVSHTIGVSGFVTAKIGHKITQTVTTTTVANDTLLFTYFDDNIQLMQLRVVYVDGTRETMMSVERTA